MIRDMSGLWVNLTTHDIWTNWNDSPTGIIYGITHESGIFNSTPAINFFNENIKERGGKIQRKIGMSCVDAVSGSYVTFDETTDDLAKAMMSTASIPFIFPY